jgi:hypothetical protein
MNTYMRRSFLSRFQEKLEFQQTCLDHELSQVLWLDVERRVNCCSLKEYLPNSDVCCVAINHGLIGSGDGLGKGAPWAGINRSRPAWRMDLTCLESELMPFAQWLAAVVNWREGRIASLTAPPFLLLNWNDSRGLNNYLSFLSTISLRSEGAFIDELRCCHPHAGTHRQRQALSLR